MTPELQSALECAYSVFEDYKDPFNCERKSGVRHPLHQMTRGDWSRMHEEFDLTVLLGDSLFYRHFLPCILEWTYEANNGEDGYWGLENLSRYLSTHGWLRWPHEEVESLRNVFGWWTCEALLYHNKKPPLALLLDVADDVRSYLNPWVVSHPIEVAQWIVEQDWLCPRQVLLRWVTQTLIEERLEAAFWDEPDGTHAALSSRSIESVRLLSASET